MQDQRQAASSRLSFPAGIVACGASRGNRAMPRPSEPCGFIPSVSAPGANTALN